MTDPRLARFRRSLYWSLACAGGCLIYAEWPFLPDMPVIAGLFCVTMVIAYALEGRWTLSIREANLVGAAIAIAAIGWVAFQLVRPGGSVTDMLPWPTGLLPFLGPLVLVLIPAKLLRTKHFGDYWGFQGIGLMAVALGSALAGDGFFGILLLGYAVTVVSCLVRFHQVRVHTVDGTRPLTDRVARLWTLPWTVVASALAIGCFLITPRVTDAKWGFAGLGNRLQTGFSEDKPAIDLNLSGQLQTSGDLAFEVRVENPDGSPKMDLSPLQRWRGATFNFYLHGKWESRPKDVVRSPVRDSHVELPNLGPQQYFLVFRTPPKANQAYIFSDPIWPPVLMPDYSRRAPVLTETDDGDRFQWPANRQGDPEAIMLTGAARRSNYRQVTAPTPEPDLCPALQQEEAYVNGSWGYVKGLPVLHRYTDKLMRELVVSGRIGWRGRAGGERPSPEWHEAIAREFEAHLRSTGLFQYSYSLSREDKSIDPIEDFVINVRKGHCNRFSSALALMLRCQGIPTRIVLGFRGAELQNDGVYAVRQSHAHSWVETLVRRPGADGKMKWFWLSLDPTPSFSRDEEPQSQLGRWVDDLQKGTSEFFKNFVIDYNADRQARARRIFGDVDPSGVLAHLPAQYIPLVAVALSFVIAGMVAYAAVVRKRRRPPPPTEPFFRFVYWLRRTGVMNPAKTRTPREIVAEFSSIVGSRSDAVQLTEQARRLEIDHYATHFGGQPTSQISDEEIRRFSRSLRSALGVS